MRIYLNDEEKKLVQEYLNLKHERKKLQGEINLFNEDDLKGDIVLDLRETQNFCHNFYNINLCIEEDSIKKSDFRNDIILLKEASKNINNEQTREKYNQYIQLYSDRNYYIILLKKKLDEINNLLKKNKSITVEKISEREDTEDFCIDGDYNVLYANLGYILTVQEGTTKDKFI